MKLVSSVTGWLLITLHGVAAGAWLSLMPGGFSLDHPRFWINRFLPTLVLAACAGATVMGIRQLLKPFSLLLTCLGGFWLTATVSTVIFFPISGWRIVLVFPPIGVACLAAAIRAQRSSGRAHMRTAAMAALCGAVLGIYVPLTQRAPKSSTHPIDDPIPTILIDSSTSPLILNAAARVSRDTGEIGYTRGRYALTLNPLLTFVSRSPDRCWTNLAPVNDRIGPPRTVRTAGRSADGSIAITFADDDQSVLQAQVLDDDCIEITAWTRLPIEVFSHLNSFSQLLLLGHEKLELIFSPCPDPVEPLYMEYPVGAPARCAAMFSDNHFAVLQATSAEKGPFHELSRGTLTAQDPVTITLRDRGRDFLEITWFDFASQTSINLSPTAGYGLPMNAFEFSLDENRPSSSMELFVSLAATSVGRGWDSVGHAAGTYRNRMRIRWLAGAKP